MAFRASALGKVRPEDDMVKVEGWFNANSSNWNLIKSESVLINSDGFLVVLCFCVFVHL